MSTLDGYGDPTVKRVEAVEKMCAVAMDLIGEGRAMELSVHEVPRDVFDSFDGSERSYPEENGHHAFWTKEVRLLDALGQIGVRLFTAEAPATFTSVRDRDQIEVPS